MKPGTPRMMVVLFAATGLVVAAVVALVLQSWWVLLGVLAVHLTATALVIWYTLRQASADYEKPDPVTEARVEERRQDRPRHRARDYEVFN